MENDKEDDLDFGETVWYEDPETKDIIYAVDGTDNAGYYSYAAIKDGILAYPEHLNHYDMWLSETYSYPEIKGFITLRNESEQSFEFRDAEIRQKFDDWAERIFAGRIAKDSSKIFLLSESVQNEQLMSVISYFTRIALITDKTMIYWNGEPTVSVSELFSKENEMKLSSTAQVDVTPGTPSDSAPMNTGTPAAPLASSEPAAPKEDQETTDIVNKYKAGDQSAGEILVNKYSRLILKRLNVNLRARGMPPLRENDFDNPSFEIFQDCLLEFLKLLHKFDPMKAKLTTYIQTSIDGIVKNALNPQRNKQENLEVSVPHSKGDTEDEMGMSFDRMPQNREQQPDANPDENSKYLRQIMDEAFKSDPKLYEVLQKRFYENKTLQEAAAEMGVSAEYIRLLENKALELLRANPLSRNLARKAELLKLEIVFNEPTTDASNDAELVPTAKTDKELIK